MADILQTFYFIDSMLPVLLPFVAVFFFLFWPRYTYNKSPYRKLTGNSYTKFCIDKGVNGEARLAHNIYKFDPAAKVFFNLYIPLADGTTTEIDEVYLTPWGIVVFESKNYSGWIFGNVNDPMWTQTLNKNTKNRFYNPIKQNLGHIKKLSSFLQLPEDCFVSIVAFSNKAAFKKLDTGCEIVIKYKEVFDALDALRRTCPVVFNNEQLAWISHRLESCAKASDEVKKQHVENIQYTISYK